MVSTLMVTGCKLSKTDESPKVDWTSYISIVDSLLYLTTLRPYIMEVVGIVGIFQEAPRQSHLLVIKRIIIYLKAIMGYGLWYPKGKKNSLTIFTNSNLASEAYD